MKKTFFALTIAASVFALSACSDKAKVDDEVLATTKVGNITKEDLYNEMKDSIGAEVLQNLVLFKAIENEYKVTDKEIKDAIAAKKEPYGENFQEYLTQNNISERYFENQAKYAFLQQKLVESLSVSEEQIEAEYDRMKREIHARHILVADEKTAQEIIDKLNAGEDFSKLAIEYSTEPIAKETGGDLGWFGIGKMVKPFEDAAFALPLKEISKPVKTSFGYHVIEVLEERDVELEKSLEELKPEIEERLKEAQFYDRIGDLLKNANVEIKAEEYKNILDAYMKTEEK